MAKRALLVVKDVSGVASLAERLVADFGFDLLANEIAGEALRAKRIAYEPVSEIDAAAMVASKESEIVLVIANFVDVESAGRAFLSWKSALGAFDRGIVDAIRAAAFAVDRVAVLGNPSDYEAALSELNSRAGKLSQPFRMQRATAALRAASEFDFAVAQYLEVQGADAPDMGALSGYSKAMRFAWPRAQLLDTGENGHQLAAVYGSFFDHFELKSGGKLDYASVLTVSRAAYFIGEFEKPAAALLRNGKIVTARVGDDLQAVTRKVLKHRDSVGAWLVVNGSLGRSNLQSGVEGRLRGILAPDFSEEELVALRQVESVTALSSISGMGYEALQEVRSVVGGVLVQDKDRVAVNPMEWTVLSLAQPLVEDWESLMFGAKIVRHADSAAVAIISGEQLISLEVGRYAPKLAWNAVEESGIGLANTVAVFDVPEVEPVCLTRMKELGVRAVLLPMGGEVEALRQAANDCGLVLLGMSKGMRRL
ncbi:hypothetical protein IEN85_12790 [Pelagicoccus sp. NFK12]|uniref:Uncharacterized protein n=1 Tax=Pelagicoccus enzymogenes TaxID=2773457 RepID=A0A927F9K2_9BACT|nr:hypothetical protein [Pelagicoccus enzymogenes]MBD5780370.1 hypothetical protein [Pelagicoccus enzymogenes]